jgi:hypothetical protein
MGADPYTGFQRRIEIKPPPLADIRTLEFLLQDKGGATFSPLNAVTLAMLCCINAEFGWFQVVKKRPRKGSRKKRPQSCLVLTDEALDELTRGMDTWMADIAQSEPMLCRPKDGLYLTGGDKVTNSGTVRGIGTDVEGTAHWAVLADVMAGTAWVSSTEWLDEETVRLDVGETYALRAYQAMGDKRFWLPIQCDFRGRAYYRTSPITPQGSDLRKALLAFPPQPPGHSHKSAFESDLAIHFSNLHAEDGIDKASIPDRLAWFRRAVTTKSAFFSDKADKPHQFRAHKHLMDEGRFDQIPIQIDGSCNGIQHLSAMFADEEAGEYVNLTPGEKPKDIYARVSERLTDRLNSDGTYPSWKSRVALLELSRGFVKQSVMTLPYGVTRVGVEEQVIGKAWEQVKRDPKKQAVWLECLERDSEHAPWVRDQQAVDDGYLAFSNRSGEEIRHHPLFKRA